MTNKKITYLLIAAVVTVWGIIIFRISSSVSDRQASVDLPEKKKAAFRLKTDTFSLLLNYPDPFLGAVHHPARSLNHSGGHKVSETRQPAAAKPRPDISFMRYIGLITNPNTQKKVALISMYGAERFAAEGQVINGVTFLKTLKDSILVSYMDNRFYIKRN